MDDDPDFSEPSVTARERALEEKIIRLEKRLEGYQAQIDIIDSQRQQLEERAIKMESALAKAKNGLLEARKELMDKETAEKEFAEKLNSMTQQAEEYKNLFMAERNKNKYSIETLEALLSTVEAEIAPRKEFQGFLNEILTEVKEGFYAQLKVVFDKLTQAESRFHRSPQEMNQCKAILTTSCSATQFGIRVKGELSTANSSSPTQYGVFGTAATTAATSNSQIPFGMIDTTAITSATSNSPIPFEKTGPFETIDPGAIPTATSNSPAQYGLISTGAIPTATSSSPTQYGMIGTTATTRASKLHFKPVIPLPDEIKVVTGEEGLEVLFSERAKLYRFDADSGQWKERGVGDVKLLRHPKSGQGRVLMTGEQLKKLCANHNINSGIELKPNVGSDRSWVWYTRPADYAAGEARPEKLAIKLKSAEIAGKFREVFEALKETFSAGMPSEVEQTDDQQGAGCVLYKQFISTFAASSYSWTCEMCYVENSANDLKCIACNSAKPGSLEPLSKTAEEDAKVILTSTNTSVVESVEPNTFQDFDKDSTSDGSIFQSPGLKGLASSRLFTIGRGESSEDKLDDEIYLSPSKMSSSSKQGVTPQTPSTLLFQENVVTSLPFGTNTPAKFTFSLQVSPESPRKSKSPLPPASPLSSQSPGHAEDDGPHFEPVIPLPEKVECRTGEEGQEVMFCERCKLFRYDSDASQWKERGVGDIKILLDPSSRRYRVLMRREHVFKLCANHMISVDMELKPFPNSDRAWLWTTLADFSDEVAAAETLGARFKTSQIATEFKDTFEKALQSLKSEAEKGLKGLASSRLFTIGRGESSEDKLDDEIYLSPSKMSSSSKQGVTPQTPSTLLFQENVVTSLPFGTNTPAKFTFSLQVSPESPRKSKSPLPPASPLSSQSPGHAEDDGPHFEPVIPLPKKVECRTGEEGQEVMFCERCKLFRYDSDASQWKERGVGDIKILLDPSSRRYRVLMRREHVFKLCANHMISVDMELKPFPNSDRAWLWTTLANFSDEVAAAETLGARFKTSQIATEFKDTFEKALQSLKSKAANIASSGKPDIKETDQETGKNRENDISLVFERRVTDDQKERAKRLELPSNFYGFENSSCGTDSRESEPVASKESKPSADVSEEISTPSKSNFLFGSSSVASLSFQSVAASSWGSRPFGQISQQKSPGFTGAGAQLFASQSTEDDAGTPEVDHDGPNFESIILLPDKIDVKTGEEDEEVMFSHRAKLYRFLADGKQWKERGVGDIKLLRNRQSGKMRVLMRRDQVLKICANHQITIDMKLQPNAGSDRSWVWSTSADFSEQECKAEQLAVRFKSEDIAKQFKEKFEECQELLKNQTPVKTLQKEQAQEEVKDDLVTKFKAAEGSWECDICMVRNDSDKVECAACGGLKPGAEPRQDQQKDTKTFPFGSSAPSSGSAFLFGSASPSTGAGFSLGSTGTSQSDERFLSFGSFGEVQNSKTGIQLRFGSFRQEHVTEQQTEDNKETDSLTVAETPRKEVMDTKDEQAQNVQDVESATEQTQAEDNNKEETKATVESDEASPHDEQTTKDPSPNAEQKFVFVSSSISSLSLQSVAATSLTCSPFGQTASKSSPGFVGVGSPLFSSKVKGDLDESVTEGDHDGPYCEPSIPLPDKIDVKTGEEDEEVMFSHRAKLYRFVADDKQWKERGVGDIKLLRNRQSGKMRVLMRRDQVLKICANHQITIDMKLQPNAGSDRSWVWSTSADFSEQECKAEQLAVRFKSEDIAKQFKEKFEECQELLKNQTPVKTSKRASPRRS